MRTSRHLGEQGAAGEASQRQDPGGPTEVRRAADSVLLQRGPDQAEGVGKEREGKGRASANQVGISTLIIHSFTNIVV